MKKILLTGGSGLIGTYLGNLLVKKGYEVAILSRSKQSSSPFTSYHWDPSTKTIDPEALNNTYALIHLAGANIGDKRWTKKRKQTIFSSRVNSLHFLYQQLEKQTTPIPVCIVASAVGYYGFGSAYTVFKETDPPASDFLAETCKQLELQSQNIAQLGTRTVCLRTGVVLSKQGGAFPKLKQSISLGIGSAVGSGKQIIPWIHIHDLCMQYLTVLEDSNYQGVYNAVAPEAVSNKQFNQLLAQIINKPFWNINVPSFLIKIVLGEMADLILKGNAVSANKIEAEGFTFTYPKIHDALGELIGN